MVHPILVGALGAHIGVVGKVGSGKTYVAKLIAEHLLTQQKRVCIIDPTGAWWGLRATADGKRKAFDIAIFGGEHGDLPIAASSGPILAQLVATRNFPCVLDLSELRMDDQRQFVTSFAETIYRLNRKPLHLIIDEADEFAPQNPLPENRRMVGDIGRIVRRGRLKGFRVIFITQRPAVLHKNVLTQANTLIAMRLMSPQDREAVWAWIRGQGDEEAGRRVIDTLAKLSRGEGWVWAPEQDVLQTVKFPTIKTYDSSRTPEEGKRGMRAIKLHDIDLSAVKASLVEAEQEAERSDPARLRAQIVRLTGELERARRQASAAPTADPQSLSEAKQRGYDAGVRVKGNLIAQLAQGMIRAANQIEAALSGMRERVAIVEQALKAPPGDTRIAHNRQVSPGTVTDAPVAPISRVNADASAEVPKAALRILRVLASFHCPLTNTEWATLSNMSVRSGTWANYKSVLNTAGYLVRDGERYAPSAKGVAACGELPPPPTQTELQERWRKSVGGGASRLLDAAIHAYPDTISRGELAGRVKMSSQSGTYANYLSKLRSNNLITVDRGMIRASDSLFMSP